MVTEKDTLTFVIPDSHPEAGVKITKEFTWDRAETEPEAVASLAVRASKNDKAAAKWSWLSLYNNAVKAGARSNAFAALSASYKPIDDLDEAKEAMVRNYIRAGKTEVRARQLVELAFAADSE